MIKEIILEIVYIFTNYFVCNIPFWPIRKLFYQLLGMKIGKGSRILMRTVIVSPWKISIGDYSYVNESCYLDGRGKIEIGSNVTIAIYSKLITGYHTIYDDFFSYVTDSIVIAHNAVLFAECICLPGVNIKEGTVFAAGTVISKNTYGPRKVYGGNPAKYIKERNIKAIYVQNSWHPIMR